MGQRGATGNLRGVGISGHAQEPHHSLTGLVQVSNWPCLRQVFIYKWDSGEQQGISTVWAFPGMRRNLIILLLAWFRSATGPYVRQVFICKWNSIGISVDCAFPDMRNKLIIRWHDSHSVWHKIFDFKFFYESVSPRTPSIPVEPFWILSKIRRDIRELMLSPVSTTPVISCSAVSTTPAKNLSPVSLTPVNNLYFPGVVDTVQKKTKKPKIYCRCQRHRRKIVHWCQRHRW